jgi:hypothetical protein
MTTPDKRLKALERIASAHSVEVLHQHAAENGRTNEQAVVDAYEWVKKLAGDVVKKRSGT